MSLLSKGSKGLVCFESPNIGAEDDEGRVARVVVCEYECNDDICSGSSKLAHVVTSHHTGCVHQYTSQAKPTL